MKETHALLIRPGGLGDLLIALPSIALVREKLPDAHLTLACRTDYGRLFIEAGLVDELMPVDSRRLSRLFGSTRAVRELSSSIIGWMRTSGIPDLPAPEEGRGIRAVVAPDSEPGEPWSRFFLRRTLDLFGDSRPVDALPSRLGRLDLSVRTRNESLAAFGFGDMDGEAVVVHTGSGSERKRWPARRFLEILRRFSGIGRRGVCVTGEAEEGTAADLDDRHMPSGWARSRSPDILRLAGLLSAARLFLGNDSGTAHLAAACGCPAVVLFLDEFVQAWSPWGTARALSAPSIEDIELERVWEELRSVGGPVR